MNHPPDTKLVEEFLKESNAIEGETRLVALNDASDAWQRAYYAAQNKDFEYTDEYVLEVHKCLLRRIDPVIAGEYRKVRVTVGGRMCPGPASIPHLMKDWFKEMKERITLHSADDQSLYNQMISRAQHIAFEKIHPFADGNGRTGRILFNVHRLQLGLPLLVIKNATKFEDYYKWFDEKTPE